MKIFNAEQLRKGDAYTIEHEPIPSCELMERAAGVFSEWFYERFGDIFMKGHRVAIVCGNGNNGGDGLAVARILGRYGFKPEAFVYNHSSEPSANFQQNMERLLNQDEDERVPLHFVSPDHDLPDFGNFEFTVDALLGIGLTRPVDGFMAELIDCVNITSNVIISIDVPSGLFIDKPTEGVSIKAQYTLTFESPKLAFLFPENWDRVGDWEARSIQMHPDYISSTPAIYHYTETADLKPFFKERQKFAHKGTFGHALLIAGSHGKIGAAVLAVRACLRSGAGLVTAHIPDCGHVIMQTAVPEAMISIDEDPHIFTRIEGFSKYDAIGIGPGLSTKNKTRNALCYILKYTEKPMVLDADALNILAASPEWLTLIPKGSILTPHPKEFERLFGASANSFERLELLREKAMELGLYIVLKGAHSATACPDGEIWFNSTGNPGMGTAGSGDVLTGIILALLAQNYTPREAAIMGVFVHGAAGDLAAERIGEMSLIANDIIKMLGKALEDIRYYTPEENIDDLLPF